MFLLVNDRCEIQYISEECTPVDAGYRISPFIVVGDKSLDMVEVEEVPEEVEPFKWIYMDREFQRNPRYVEPANPVKMVEELQSTVKVLTDKLTETKPGDLSLEDLRQYLRDKNNDLLKEFLKSHPLLWTNGKHYGVTEEDQNQLLGNYNGWKMDQALGIDSKLEWNACNEACTEWTEPELLMLISAIYKYAKKMVKLCQKYKVLIINATTKAELSSIDLVYTEELADELMNKE